MRICGSDSDHHLNLPIPERLNPVSLPRHPIYNESAPQIFHAKSGFELPINARTLNDIVGRELATVTDARVVAHIQELLVSPNVVLRDWDYGSPGQQYPCWIVLNDAEHSDTAIGYCEYGFGPRCPWGLLHYADDPQHQSMGMDSGWFPTFLEAFFDSFAATRLPIWRIFKAAGDGTRTPLTDEGPWQDTWKRIEALRSHDPTTRYDCDHSISYGR